jgi:hypothetical protein
MNSIDKEMYLMSFAINLLWSAACATLLWGASGNGTVGSIMFLILFLSGISGLFSVSKGPEPIGGTYLVSFIFMFKFWFIALSLCLCGIILLMIPKGTPS